MCCGGVSAGGTVTCGRFGRCGGRAPYFGVARVARGARAARTVQQWAAVGAQTARLRHDARVHTVPREASLVPRAVRVSSALEVCSAQASSQLKSGVLCPSFKSPMTELKLSWILTDCLFAYLHQKHGS